MLVAQLLLRGQHVLVPMEQLVMQGRLAMLELALPVVELVVQLLWIGPVD
jgi:hypothetical protein